MKRILLAIFALIAASISIAPRDALAEGPNAKAILAGGCFWCLEHDFRALPGIVDAISGYSGGSQPNPTYENYHDVSSANPVPHVEVVQVTYDTSKLSYDQVLDYFYRHIDPTDGGGQFCDRGAAYRPVVYYGSDTEQAAAKSKQTAVSKQLNTVIAVDILPAKTFWPAEDYHQDYAAKNPVRYKYYRWNCGRDQKVNQVWRAASN